MPTEQEPTNEGQVETTPEGQVEETPVVEQTLQEQVGQLLKPTQEELETEEVQPQTQQSTQEELIDDTLIEQYPALKMYRGQKFKDALPKAYSEIVKKFTKTNMELKELQKKQLQSSIPNPSDFPDPVEKPEEFKQAIADFREKVRQEALNEPRQEQPNMLNEVAKHLPEGADVNDAIAGWEKDNAFRLYDDTGLIREDQKNFYNQNPHIFIREVVKYYSDNLKVNKTQAQIQSESKAQAAKNLQDAIRKANSNKENQPSAQVNATARENTLTAEEELLLKIQSKVS
jgi:hypothetical protein